MVVGFRLGGKLQGDVAPSRPAIEDGVPDALMEEDGVAGVGFERGAWHVRSGDVVWTHRQSAPLVAGFWLDVLVQRVAVGTGDDTQATVLFGNRVEVEVDLEAGVASLIVVAWTVGVPRMFGVDGDVALGSCPDESGSEDALDGAVDAVVHDHAREGGVLFDEGAFRLAILRIQGLAIAELEPKGVRGRGDVGYFVFREQMGDEEESERLEVCGVGGCDHRLASALGMERSGDYGTTIGGAWQYRDCRASGIARGVVFGLFTGLGAGHFFCNERLGPLFDFLATRPWQGVHLVGESRHITLLHSLKHILGFVDSRFPFS